MSKPLIYLFSGGEVQAIVILWLLKAQAALVQIKMHGCKLAIQVISSWKISFLLHMALNMVVLCHVCQNEVMASFSYPNTYVCLFVPSLQTVVICPNWRCQNILQCTSHLPTYTVETIKLCTHAYIQIYTHTQKHMHINPIILIQSVKLCTAYRTWINIVF